MKYKVYLSTKIDAKKLGKLDPGKKGIVVIESDDYSKTEIKALKATGYKVLAYLSVGTIEKERSWWKKYKKYSLKKLEDWPNEYFADLTKKAWRLHLYDEARKIKKKGFDGLWLDNIDVYEYYKSNDMKDAIFKIFAEFRFNIFKEGYLMINGGSKLIEDAWVLLSHYIDGYTQEEVFSRITSYKGSGKFGKQKKEESTYYKETIIPKCKIWGIDVFLLEYTKDPILKKKIKDFECSGYYISKDVDL